MTLRILATGGTLDKHYDEIQGKLGFSQSHLPEILERCRITLPVVLETLPLMDSLDMTEEDRQRIVKACQRSPEAHLVIIHGTDTMTLTAKTLGEASLDKTIVITGAMRPYELSYSDALFNFGFACGVAQTLKPEVYIAMNGQVFAWRNVEKNRGQGVFQTFTP